MPWRAKAPTAAQVKKGTTPGRYGDGAGDAGTDCVGPHRTTFAQNVVRRGPHEMRTSPYCVQTARLHRYKPHSPRLSVSALERNFRWYDDMNIDVYLGTNAGEAAC
jgi:hypothetical protein